MLCYAFSQVEPGFAELEFVVRKGGGSRSEPRKLRVARDGVDVSKLRFAVCIDRGGDAVLVREVVSRPTVQSVSKSSEDLSKLPPARRLLVQAAAFLEKRAP